MKIHSAASSKHLKKRLHSSFRCLPIFSCEKIGLSEKVRQSEKLTQNANWSLVKNRAREKWAQL